MSRKKGNLRCNRRGLRAALGFGLAAFAVTAIVPGTNGVVAPVHAAAPENQCLNLPRSKVAIQSYTFMSVMMGFKLPESARDLPPLKKFESLGWLFTGEAKPPSPEVVEAVFRKIRQIGFRNIEDSSFSGPHTPASYAALLKKTRLRAVASHDALDGATWEQTLARAKAAKQRYVGSGGWGNPGPDTLDHLLKTAKMLNERGRAAADLGMRFYVHNHTGEFTSRHLYDRGDGKPVMTSAWEIVAANTDPALVSFEIDIYWAREAFGMENKAELLDFLRKYRSRIVLLHMKDSAPNGVVADMGKGTTDWRSVVDAAGPGIGYYVYEFDLPEDPARSARIGFEYLTCRKAGG